MTPFTNRQQSLLLEGKILADSLVAVAEEALCITKMEYQPKRHHYIYSPPGAGKTFTIASVADKHDIPLVKIQGAASMNAVTNMLAFANHYTEGQIFIWVDDCDFIFMNSDSMNVTKGALDADRNVFAWNKNMTTQIMTLRKGGPNQSMIADALEAHQVAGGVGIEIPTDRMNFIITSNKKLAGKNPKNQREMDESAIRSRVNYHSYDVDKDRAFGWLAHVVMTNDVFDGRLNEEQQRELLLWMDANWSRLAENSMRTVKDLAALMINRPTDYPDHWELRFLDN